MQLVERVCGETDGEEEGENGGAEHRPRGSRGARAAPMDHVADVPERVGRVEQRPPVRLPVAVARVERGTDGLALVTRSTLCPTDQSTAQLIGRVLTASSPAARHASANQRPPGIADRTSSIDGPRKRPTWYHSRPPVSSPANGSTPARVGEPARSGTTKLIGTAELKRWLRIRPVARPGLNSRIVAAGSAT